MIMQNLPLPRLDSPFPIPRILLLGKGGQVGWELQRSLAPLGELIAVDFDSTELCGDFTNLAGLAATVQVVKPDVIVNAAAHTAVDKAESEPDLARLINADAPGVLAREAAKLGALLVHYSTDYVFDGSGDTPKRESDATGPLSVYGQTKLEGEQAVALAGCPYLVLRTSWVYAARGANFAKTMLKLASERDTLGIIADQIGAPTGAELLADVTAHAVAKYLGSREWGVDRGERPSEEGTSHSLLSTPCFPSGIYHCVAGGETNWHDYACFVFDTARKQGRELKVSQINAIPTSAYPTPAQRPHNSRLDTQKLQQAFGLTLPHWQHGVARMLTEILQTG